MAGNQQARSQVYLLPGLDAAGKSQSGEWLPALQIDPLAERANARTPVGHAPFRILIISDLMVDRCDESETSRGQDH